MSNTTDDFVNALLESRVWSAAGFDVQKAAVVSEPKATETPTEEVVEESEDTEVHMCPLCESNLEGPLDPENVSLFVEALLSDDEDGEMIEEDSDEDSTDKHK